MRVVVSAGSRPASLGRRPNRSKWKDAPGEIPAWLITHGEVSALALVTYAMLKQVAKRTRQPAVKELAAELGRPLRQVERALYELRTLGLIVTEGVGRHKRYIFTDHLWRYHV